MKNFSGREIFGGETIGGTDPRIRLRHTDVIGRGNVRSMMNVRDFHLGSERKRGGIRKVSPAARDGGTRKEGQIEEIAVKEPKMGFRFGGGYLPYLHTFLGGDTTSY